ncbi:hypothetical protein C9374_002744 [Naegleria lovaniensis]|uniref:Uncharacterized protein n=1 Tax=Naegleria lovaniensis TaxID=51637 RepID=A0AA88GU22_NAELO|nr:uncharacterized protein C9374_002744 [Naegleria lovaniensis]KAG2386298.1 hypothetical protein C9374_002744 [Naegleria lovaniensis]
MSQQFVVVTEKITKNDKSTEVWSAIKCSEPAFTDIFNVPYPTNATPGQVIAKVDVEGTSLTVSWASETLYDQASNSFLSLYQPMTPGTWTLFQLLSKKGFRLLQQRNYWTVQGGTFQGRELAERIFVRDANKSMHS